MTISGVEQVEIMTVSEVAKYLRIGQGTIYKLLANGELPGFKIGGSWRVQRKALQSWISNSKAHSNPA